MSAGACSRKQHPRPAFIYSQLTQQEAVAYREPSERTRKQRNSHARLLLAAFGYDKVVEYLTLADVERHVSLRKRGKILSWATTVQEPDGNWLLRD